MALRILHVSPYYEDAWAYGGIPRVASSLARGLARRGHAVTVYATDACDRASRVTAPGAARSRADGVDVRIFPNLSNALAYHLQLFVPLGLGAHLRRHAGDFDVAHLHGCHHLPGAMAARHLRRTGVPYVLAPHGTAPLIERRRLAKRLFDLTLGRGVGDGAARLLAVTDAERRQLVRLGADPARIRVVPNPLDLGELDMPLERGAFRARAGLDAGPVVLFLGKLTPRKRVDVLVEAVAALGRPDITLAIAGNDLGEGRRLRRLVRRRRLEARTRFLGLLTGRVRLEALADADVVVYPSRDEVFGLVPMEALLCGTPVVVADDSGCGEVVARTGGGRVAREGDPAALAAAIREILGAARVWRERAAAAGARARTLYGCDSVSAEIEAVYREVIGAATAVAVAGHAP